jgi:DUF177 domain-containing protein
MAGSGPETIVDLGRLALSHGEGRRLYVELAADWLALGGVDYTATEEEAARLQISRTTHGYAFYLAFRANVRGPCMRCLEPADVGVDVEAREVEDPRSDDEELRSPYVNGEVLEVGRWAHDSLVLALPLQLLCRPDCAGLCPVCGASLNDADPADHGHAQVRDTRWSKLDELSSS